MTPNLARVCAALVGALASAAPVAHATSPPKVTQVEFKGAVLGMTLESWRALPFPEKTMAPALPVCRPGAQSSQSQLGNSANESAAGEEICTYRVGDELSPNIALGQHFFAHDIQYVFKGDKLAEISFWSSEDAFSDMVARLRAAYDAPTRITRDTVSEEYLRQPRVQMEWDKAQAVITLKDPASRPDRLAVRYASVKNSAS